MEASDVESRTVTVRPLTNDDGPSFVRFASKVDAGERRFLKEDLTRPADAFAGFLLEARARRLVAVEHEEIVGLAGAFPGDGWSSHVAELRVLVSEERRGHGVGRALAREALLEALRLGCTHAYVEVVAEQDALVAMFQDLGFEPEALLADFVRDSHGHLHDLMLLTHRADVQWSRNQILGLGEVIA